VRVASLLSSTPAFLFSYLCVYELSCRAGCRTGCNSFILSVTGKSSGDSALLNLFLPITFLVRFRPDNAMPRRLPDTSERVEKYFSLFFLQTTVLWGEGGDGFRSLLLLPPNKVLFVPFWLVCVMANVRSECWFFYASSPYLL